MELVAVPDAEPVVDGQHHEPAAGQVLVQRIGVRVVVGIVPAQQHLPRRASMHEDHRGLLRSRTRVAARALEELGVDVEAVGRLEDDLSRHHELRLRIARGHEIGGEQTRRRGLASPEGERHRDRRAHCGRAQEHDVRAVAGHDRRPFQAGARREDLRRRAIDGRLDDVPPIHVVGIRPGVRGEDEQPPVRAQLDVLGYVRARREKEGLFILARGRDRVEMGPAVHVGQEHDPIARRPVQVRLAVRRGVRPAQGLRARPERARFTRLRIRRPDRPGHVPCDEYGSGRAARARPPYEGEAPAVGRPAWRHVARGRRGDPDDRLGGAGEDADERVVAAVGHEGQARAVRGPLGRAVLPAQGDERLGRHRAVQRRDPDLMVLLERDDVAPGRDRRQVAVAEGLGLATVEGHRPDLHLGRRGTGRGIYQHAVVPASGMVAPAHVDGVLAVRGEGEARDLLTVVRRIAGESPRRELRPFRHPDVALSLLVEGPGDPAAGGGRGELVREGRALHVLDGEAVGASSHTPRWWPQCRTRCGGARGGERDPGTPRDRDQGQARPGQDGHGETSGTRATRSEA